MYIYDKYIIRSLFMPVIVITLTLTGIVWITQSLRFIDLIVNKGLDVSTFLYLSLLLIPSVLLLILPVALFVSVLMVYNKFISDSEMIVLKSAGLSRVKLAVPALIVAGVITVIGYFISLYLLPASYREFKDTQAFIRNNYASVLLQEGVFSNPTKGLTVYIESRGSKGMLYGILVHDGRDPEKPATIMAQEGMLVRTSQGPRFELRNGHTQRLDKKTGNLYVLDFDSDQYDLSIYTENNERDWRTPEECFINELFVPEDVDEKFRGKYIAEGHYRLIWPLFSFVFTLIALAALFSGQFNRRGQWKRILAATSIAVILLLLNLTFKGMAARTNALAILMYLNVFISAGASLYIIISHRNINSIPIIDSLINKIKKSRKSGLLA